jgi:hypothetical protein
MLGITRVLGTLLEVAWTSCCVLWIGNCGRGVPVPTSKTIAGAIARYGSEGAVAGRDV